jgi:diguanylate cyclase (GGDEF)-like protein
MLLDVDDFELVNDSLGHAAGDQLLVEPAGRSRGILRDGQTVARLGGGEFGLVAERLDGENAVVALADRVQSVFGAPFELEERGQPRQASLVIAEGVENTSPPPNQPRRSTRTSSAPPSRWAATRSRATPGRFRVVTRSERRGKPSGRRIGFA